VVVYRQVRHVRYWRVPPTRFWCLVALSAIFLSACPNPPEAPEPTYRLVYDGNGATGGALPVDDNAYREGQTAIVLANNGNLLRSGFTFVGWNTQPDDGGTTYSGGQTLVMGSSDITLYARWTALPTFVVIYDGNGNTSGAVPLDSNHYLAGQTVTVLSNAGNLAKLGFVFAGWNTRADGNGTAYLGGDTFNLGTADLTLFAEWAVAYSVTYEANGATAGTAPADGMGYPEGAVVTVLGNSGGLIRTDYAFAGWNTKADGTGTTYTQGQTFTISNSSVVLYAKWTPAHSVTYNGNGATGGVAPTDSGYYAPGQMVTVRGNTGDLSKFGFVFRGWNTLANGSGTNYSGNQTFVMGVSNVVLYAKWIAAYTIAYDVNGATGGSVPATPTLYGQGEMVTVQGNSGDLSKTGETFVGWNTQSNGGGIAYIEAQTFVISGADVTLYAQWTALPTYRVYYDPNGASGGSAPVDLNNYLQGRIATVKPNTGSMVKTDHAFSGWNTKADGTGDSYAVGQGILIGTSDILLYARWVGVITTAAQIPNNDYLSTVTAGESANFYFGTEYGTYYRVNPDGSKEAIKVLGGGNAHFGMALDRTGNIYIADRASNQVLMISSGQTYIVAGTGVEGYSGDGGFATAAKLSNPGGIALDSAGNLYIADQGNGVIRKVDATGIITTIPGAGGGRCVTVDSEGNLYIGEPSASRIKKVDPSGVVTTFASGIYASGIVVDATGNLYVATAQVGQNIVRYSPSGVGTVFAGTGVEGFSGDGGPAIAAQFRWPYDVAIDSAGYLFIADLFNYRVRKVPIQ
jgi:uncharacterized repeat protein (TIGR02543 family)